MKKGLTLISKIILIFVVLLIGFSSYTAYLYFSDGDFDFYGFGPGIQSVLGVEDAKLVGLPDELQPYAVGEDADMFIIAQLDDIPLPDNKNYEPFKDIDTVLVVGKGCPKCVLGSYITTAILFKSEKGAEDFKKFYDEDDNMRLVMGRFKSSIERRVVVLSGSSDFRDDFNGRLVNNPHMAFFSEDDMKANFVFYADNIKISEFSMLSFALFNSIAGGMQISFSGQLLPLAHAQGPLISPNDQPGRLAEATGGQGGLRMGVMTMLNFVLGIAKDFYGFVDYDDGRIQSKFKITIPSREQFSGLASIRTVYGDNPAKGDMDRLYNDMLGNFETRMGGIEKFVDELKKEYPDVDLDFSYTKNTIDVETSFSLEDFAPDPENPGDMPSKTRDVSRKADLNNIVVALEIYNADTGSYPQKTACVSDLSELKKYFSEEKFPEDHNGAQTFETEDGSVKIICDNGYLYQSFGGYEYVIWARMENTNNGNLPFFVTNGFEFKEMESGRYYVVNAASVEKSSEMYPYGGVNSKKTPDVLNTTTGVKKGVPRI